MFLGAFTEIGNLPGESSVMSLIRNLGNFGQDDNKSTSAFADQLTNQKAEFFRKIY